MLKLSWAFLINERRTVPWTSSATLLINVLFGSFDTLLCVYTTLQITLITGLDSLTNLQRLDLSYNKITTIGCLFYYNCNWYCLIIIFECEQKIWTLCLTWYTLTWDAISYAARGMLLPWGRSVYSRPGTVMFVLISVLFRRQLVNLKTLLLFSEDSVENNPGKRWLLWQVYDVGASSLSYLFLCISM